MGEKRVVCGYHGNAQSLSYNYMGKNGSRTFTPRYTPRSFLPTPFSLPYPLAAAAAVAAPLLLLLFFFFFFFDFLRAFFYVLLLASLAPSPPLAPPSSSSFSYSTSSDCFFYVFYSSSGFTSPSHRTAAPTLPASGILCLHLTGATV